METHEKVFYSLFWLGCFLFACAFAYVILRPNPWDGCEFISRHETDSVKYIGKIMSPVYVVKYDCSGEIKEYVE